MQEPAWTNIEVSGAYHVQLAGVSQRCLKIQTCDAPSVGKRQISEISQISTLRPINEKVTTGILSVR